MSFVERESCQARYLKKADFIQVLYYAFQKNLKLILLSKLSIISLDAWYSYYTEVEAAVDANTQCSTTCPVSSGSSTTVPCGGPGGLVSVYKSFAAFSTLDLVLEVTNLQNETVATTVDEVKDAPKKVSTGEVYITLF